jgi:hypothetical protein
MERGRDGRSRPHSVHFTQQNGEADSDKENQGPARGQVVKSRTGQDTVITASTWLSNILPAPREEGSVARDLSPSPQHRAVTQVHKELIMYDTDIKNWIPGS